jgi:hypothetical protein
MEAMSFEVLGQLAGWLTDDGKLLELLKIGVDGKVYYQVQKFLVSSTGYPVMFAHKRFTEIDDALNYYDAYWTSNGQSHLRYI